jgi:hypothetical protein
MNRQQTTRSGTERISLSRWMTMQNTGTRNTFEVVIPPKAAPCW